MAWGWPGRERKSQQGPNHACQLDFLDPALDWLFVIHLTPIKSNIEVRSFLRWRSYIRRLVVWLLLHFFASLPP